MDLSPAATSTKTGMNFGHAISSGIRNFVTWKGRASRSEYWWWTLFAVLVSLPFTLIYQASAVSASMSSETREIFTPAYFLLLLVQLALFLPSLAMLVRRLHDTNRSGAWYWISLVPLVGGIMLFVFTLQASTSSPNRFDS